MSHQEMKATLPEIDIHDLLKQRVMDGHPIVQIKPANLDAKTSATLDKVMNSETTKLKEETGLPVKVIQVVQMPVLKERKTL